MSAITSIQRSVCTLFAAALACAGPSAARAEDAAPVSAALETAARMVRGSGAPGGICAIIGSEDADLALALSQVALPWRRPLGGCPCTMRPGADRGLRCFFFTDGHVGSAPAGG